MKWILSMTVVIAVGLSAYWATRVNGEATPRARVLQVEAASETTRPPVRVTSERDLSLVRQRLSELTDEMNGLRAKLEKHSASAAEKLAEGTPPRPPRTPEARAEQERLWHEHMAKVEIIDDGTGQVQRDLPLLASDLGETLPNVQAKHQDLGGGRLLMTLYLTKSSTSPGAMSATGALGR